MANRSAARATKAETAALERDNADTYNSLKDKAGKNVSVTGSLLTRSGMKAIEASAVQVASK